MPNYINWANLFNIITVFFQDVNSNKNNYNYN